MLARLCLTSLLLLLAACQNTSVNRDYDSSRDFGAYRSWSWQEPALQYRPDDPRLRSDLTEQRVRDALSEQLEQRGLRAAAVGAGADLKVQAWLIVDERQEQISTHYGGAWGGWNDYWRRPATPRHAGSTIRSPPCSSTCSTPRTASWCGAAAPNRSSASNRKAPRSARR